MQATRRCGDGWRKPVEEINDRSKRQRANAPECRPRGPKRCAKCGRRPPDTRWRPGLVVDHRDGDESNTKRSNLRWLCYSCNIKEAIRLKRLGKGVRTRQFNPGAKTLGEYVAAAVEHKRGAIDAGGKIIHETPKAKRRSFAREICRRKMAAGRVQHCNGTMKRKKRNNPAFNVKLQPSPELAAVTGRDPLTRAEATRKLWEYIKRHGLQDASDKRQIRADGVLRRIFRKDKANMLELGGILAKNLSVMNPARKASSAKQRRGKSRNPAITSWLDNSITYDWKDAAQASAVASRFNTKENRDNYAKPSGSRVTFFGLQFKNRALSEFGRRLANPGAKRRRRARNIFGFGKAKRAVQAFVRKRRPFWDNLTRGQRYHVAREAGLIAHDATRAARMSWRSLKKGPLKEFAESLQENYKAMTRHGQAVPNPGARTAAAKRTTRTTCTTSRRRKRRNPAATSAKAYKVFHGAEPTRISSVPEPDRHQEELAALGNLKTLGTRTIDGKKVGIYFDPDARDRVMVCCNPERTQIYFTGGSQDITDALGRFGVDRHKQFIDLGECILLVYTSKKRLHHFEDVEYTHELGEESGVCPRLMFDTLNKRLSLVGGRYKIQEPGIID